MPFHGNVGRSYSRYDVTAAIGLHPTNQGNWSGGYPNHNDEFFIFANIGEAGRIGPRYETYWDNGQLSWPTVNSGHLEQAAISDLVSNKYPVHIFFRYSDRSKFIYAGPATADRVAGTKPVRVWWAFNEAPRNAELKGILAANGFQLHVPSTHAQLASKGTLNIYIKTKTDEYPLVLPPSFEGSIDELTSIIGVRKVDTELFYHNSGMKVFPKRRNTGRSLINFGLAFGFDTGESLVRFLKLLSVLSPSDAKVPDRLGRGRQQQIDPRTETEAVRAARLGQSGFRSDLLLRYNETCVLAGVNMPELLRASHIKPWHTSSNDERLDPDNGLLLSIHLDLLFDKGFISFEDDGTIKLSTQLKSKVIETYGLTDKLKLAEVFPGNLPYLRFHRLNVFK